MKSQRSSPKWDVIINQYGQSGTFIRNFTFQVEADTEDLARQVALNQINMWAVGNFGVNIASGDTTTGVRRPFIRYGTVGARNRIISIKRTK